MKKKSWQEGSTEEKVSKFYAHGVENFGEFHKGYLNFGLWEDGNKDYIVAAENLIRRLGKMLELNGDSHLLDVACGMGAQDVLLAQEFSPKKITCLDLMFEHLEYGKARAKQGNVEERMEFVHGTATELPFEKNTFDRVLCVEGLVHFNTREKFFRESFDKLKNGGIFVASDYCLAKTPRSRLSKLALDATYKLWNIPPENAIGVDTYKEKLENAGFSDVEIHQVGEQVIPGYFYEQHSKECLDELTRIRGFVAGRLGHIIDYAVYYTHKWGLIDYILVKAKKP